MILKFAEKTSELSAEYNINGEIILAAFEIQRYKADEKKNELSKNNLTKFLSEIATQILFNYGDNRVTFCESEGGETNTIMQQGPFTVQTKQPNRRCEGRLYQTKDNYLKVKEYFSKKVFIRSLYLPKYLLTKPNFFSPGEGLVVCNESGLTNSKLGFFKKPEYMKSKEIGMSNFCGFESKSCEFVKKHKGKLFEVEGDEFLRYVEEKINYILEETEIGSELIYSALKDLDPRTEENSMIS
jgi:hypothetical protein